MAIDLVQLRNEIRAIAAPMQTQINYLASRLDNIETEVQSSYAQINQLLRTIQPYEYELIFDRAGSCSVMSEALKTAQQQVIIVCPWLTHYGVQEWVSQQLERLLSRNVRVKIGWGRLEDLEQGKTDNSFWYGALPKLRQLQHNYPEMLQLKALGTHEKYLVCDRQFAMLGSHNVLTSGVSSTEREVGLRTTDSRIIQGLINRFQNARNLEAKDTYRGGKDWECSCF